MKQTQHDAPDPSAGVLVRRAVAGDADALAPLFDAYRQFYEQRSDPAGARAFMRERLERGDSVLLLATSQGEPVGFAQLYPTLSSISMARVFVLNDLFVRPDARRYGVGALLLRASIAHARDEGACRIELSTARTNEPARRLYLAYGFEPDRGFDHLSLSLDT